MCVCVYERQKIQKRMHSGKENVGNCHVCKMVHTLYVLTYVYMVYAYFPVYHWIFGS